MERRLEASPHFPKRGPRGGDRVIGSIVDSAAVHPPQVPPWKRGDDTKRGPGTPIGARVDSLWYLGTGTLLLAILRFGPVSSYPGFPICGFHWLTGRPCPLCGMTRAFVCLVKGDWLMAVHLNILSPLLFGIFLATIGSALLRFLAIEISYPADLGLRRAEWWRVCLMLFVVYGLLRICRLVP